MARRAAEQFPIQLTVPTGMVEEIDRALTAAEASEVQIPKARPTAALLTVTVAAVIAITAAAELIMRLRAKRSCRQIIDTRAGTIKTELNCDVRDGRVIVITSCGDKVEIADVSDAINLTKVLEAAIGRGGRDVREAAAGAGAEPVDDPPRRSNSSS